MLAIGLIAYTESRPEHFSRVEAAVVQDLTVHEDHLTNVNESTAWTNATTLLFLISK